MSANQKPPGQPPPNSPPPRTVSGSMAKVSQQARINASAEKARVAFQGDDEFSVMSLDPEISKNPLDIKGVKKEEAQGEQQEGSSFWKSFRRVFGR